MAVDVEVDEDERTRDEVDTIHVKFSGSTFQVFKHTENANRTLRSFTSAEATRHGTEAQRLTQDGVVGTSIETPSHYPRVIEIETSSIGFCTSLSREKRKLQI
jgi:hypothetical protein